MKEYRLKSYAYTCKCGYVLTVYIDSGVPQEQFKCRRCGMPVPRKEN